jgi:hypothetical protein
MSNELVVRSSGEGRHSELTVRSMSGGEAVLVVRSSGEGRHSEPTVRSRSGGEAVQPLVGEHGLYTRATERVSNRA